MVLQVPAYRAAFVVPGEYYISSPALGAEAPGEALYGSPVREPYLQYARKGGALRPETTESHGRVRRLSIIVIMIPFLIATI